MRHDDHEFHEKLLKLADLFLKYVKEMKEDIHGIGEAVFSAHSATLTFTSDKGESMNSVTIVVGKTAQATLNEWDGLNGAGNKVPPIGPVVYQSDNAAIATVDPSTGVITGVAAGVCNITGVDQGNNLSASGVCTVQEGVVKAQSATLDMVAL